MKQVILMNLWELENNWNGFKEKLIYRIGFFLSKENSYVIVLN